MTPPSVMPVRWWMLWMPKEQMAAPSKIIRIIRPEKPSPSQRTAAESFALHVEMPPCNSRFYGI